MEFFARVKGTGCKSKIKILLDSYENGEEIGACDIGMDDGVYSTIVKNVTGRHAIYFVVEACFGGWFKDMFSGRHLFELEEFTFCK
jgi:arabinoxylan arabinofuranohydrolase